MSSSFSSCDTLEFFPSVMRRMFLPYLVDELRLSITGLCWAFTRENIQNQSVDQRDTSERDTSERDTSERDTSERDTSERDTSERDTSKAGPVIAGPSEAGPAEAEPTAENKPAGEEECAAGPAEAGSTSAEPTDTVQAVMVNFFWDKLHWVPQGVLYLPKEEGGKGLTHLQSRTAAFHLLFIQRLLNAAALSSCQATAFTLLHNAEGLQMDRSLFLMDPAKLDTSRLPGFWNFFTLQRANRTHSLHWLLKELLIHGARFNISNSNCFFPGFNS
ncbi:hypothetical protein QTP86_005014 [Hemibagrus guttatus]|nr:hypothetical protein QTP86_005014 [Hemibagrus guttatus]